VKDFVAPASLVPLGRNHVSVKSTEIDTTVVNLMVSRSKKNQSSFKTMNNDFSINALF